MTRWGIVSTIKAPLEAIQAFAAHHLELGAHRIFIYLDDPDPETEAALRAHSKVRVRACDRAYWKASGQNRPKKHQPRQTFNASQAYAAAKDVDWLCHIDVDEFLWSDGLISGLLDALPDSTRTARVRPMELLSGSDTAYKAWIPPGPNRDRITARLYPTFGGFLKGGFLSHVAGKVFVRTSMAPVTFKIHNVFLGEEMNPGLVELDAVNLLHRHAPDWDEWKSTFRFRMEQGSYRTELGPNRPREKGGLRMHELFTAIEADGGEKGLRAFFGEVCQDSPHLRAALESEGLLRICDLDLARKTAQQFGSG